LFTSTPNLLVPFSFFFLFIHCTRLIVDLNIFCVPAASSYIGLVDKVPPTGTQGPQFQPPYTYGQAGQNNSTNKNATGTYVPICILLDYCLHAKVSWHENWALQLA